MTENAKVRLRHTLRLCVLAKRMRMAAMAMERAEILPYEGNSRNPPMPLDEARRLAILIDDAPFLSENDRAILADATQTLEPGKALRAMRMFARWQLVLSIILEDHPFFAEIDGYLDENEEVDCILETTADPDDILARIAERLELSAHERVAFFSAPAIADVPKKQRDETLAPATKDSPNATFLF
jgi:hypothetical protein